MRAAPSPRISPSWLLRFLAVLSLWGPACVGDHPKSCTQSGDCQPGGVCDGQGFCTHECRTNVDCPCGSACNRSCGLCLRADTGGLATCFAVDRNVSVNEALGACRAGAADAGSNAGADATTEQEGGACLPAPVKLTCGIDAGALVPTADAGETHDADATRDARLSPDAVRMTDASSPAVGQ
jgi:hypothetical protein